MSFFPPDGLVWCDSWVSFHLIPQTRLGIYDIGISNQRALCNTWPTSSSRAPWKFSMHWSLLASRPLYFQSPVHENGIFYTEAVQCGTTSVHTEVELNILRLRRAGLPFSFVETCQKIWRLLRIFSLYLGMYWCCSPLYDLGIKKPFSWTGLFQLSVSLRQGDIVNSVVSPLGENDLRNTRSWSLFKKIYCFTIRVGGLSPQQKLM